MLGARRPVPFFAGACFRCVAASSSSAVRSPRLSSMPAHASVPVSRRSCTDSIVYAAGSHPGTSSQVSGMETRASSEGRTEYPDAVV